MKVLVFDHCLKVTGHRLHYASLVAEAFVNGHEVVLGLPDIIEHSPQVSALAARSFSTDFYSFSEKKKSKLASALFDALAARNCLIQMIERHKPDLVAVPTADGLAIVTGFLSLFPLTALRDKKIEICVMRGPQNYSGKLKQAISDVKWWLVRQGPWQRIMMMDPREWSRRNKGKEILLCPDPVPKQKHFDQIRARNILGLPPDGRIVVSVGPQNMRKGSDRLLKGFAAANLNHDDRLVMIGKIDPAITPLVQSSGLNERLIVRDEFVTEDEFQMAIVASDVVAVPYRAVDRPSGIVCRSMAWKRPMVMTNRGWLKWILDEYDAGFGFDPDDLEQLAETIVLALDESSRFRISEKTNQFINFHTEENYSHIWRCGIDYDAG